MIVSIIPLMNHLGVPAAESDGDPWADESEVGVPAWSLTDVFYPGWLARYLYHSLIRLSKLLALSTFFIPIDMSFFDCLFRFYRFFHSSRSSSVKLSSWAFSLSTLALESKWICTLIWWSCFTFSRKGPSRLTICWSISKAFPTA